MVGTTAILVNLPRGQFNDRTVITTTFLFPLLLPLLLPCSEDKKLKCCEHDRARLLYG